MCVPCHGVLPAIALRKTALGWAASVEDMRVKGAKGSDEQAEAAAKYLSQHFAAVNVNTATADELVKLAELSAEDAAAIIAFRGDGKPFRSYTDVKKVPGVDPKRLAAAKPRCLRACDEISALGGICRVCNAHRNLPGDRDADGPAGLRERDTGRADRRALLGAAHFLTGDTAARGGGHAARQAGRGHAGLLAGWPATG